VGRDYDVDGMAKAIRRALGMSLDERRERWSKMMNQLREYDVHGWRDAFLDTLLGFSKRHGTTERTGDLSRAPTDGRRRKGRPAFHGAHVQAGRRLRR
jgi:trehalose 6-phosphate synthase